MRLTRADNSEIVLQNPRIAVGDSLAGLHNGAPASVAISDVKRVAIRKFSAGGTIGLIAGVSVVAFLIAINAAVKGGGL